MIPPLVQRAEALAVRLGFPRTHDEGPGPSCCLPDIGRLLAVLAAGCAGGRIGEIGTGVGYGAAWMASAMPADATLVTVELDEARARAAQDLFADDGRVTVVHGDASAVIPDHGPYDLLFVDGGTFSRDAAGLASLLDVVRVGGHVVVDDITPGRADDDDGKRAAFFGTDRLQAVEIACTDLRNGALVGTRIR